MKRRVTYVPYRTQKGSTLIFSVLLVTIILAVSLSIGTIAYKELQFASFGKESQKAFYAADAGIECAFYHDFIRYSGSGQPSAFPATGGEVFQDVDCLNDSLESGDPEVTVTNIPGGEKSEFYIEFSNNDNDPCVYVSVTKEQIGAGNVKTTIESRGVNVSDKSSSDCAAAANQTRRVQRAIKVEYGGS